jgi:predicted amidohydrolase YtcJ
MAVLNSLAMKILRLEELLNSNVLRDDMGIATGLVRESAAFTAWERVVSEMPLEDLEKSILDAAKHLASLGVTAVDVAGCSLEELKALLSLWSKGLLPIRVRVHVSLEVFNVLKKTGITFQFGDEFLKVIGVKLFIDGSLGARTAWLSKPYADDPSNTSVCVTPPSTLEAVAREADSIGCFS